MLDHDKDEETPEESESNSKKQEEEEQNNDTYPQEFNTWEALNKSLTSQRAQIIAMVTGHPNKISVKELSYILPDLKEDSIRNHLKELLKVCVVEEHELEERKRDYPYKFYTVSEQARNLFNDKNLFPRKQLTEQYKAIQKTPEIKEIERMPKKTKEPIAC